MTVTAHGVTTKVDATVPDPDYTGFDPTQQKTIGKFEDTFQTKGTSETISFKVDKFDPDDEAYRTISVKKRSNLVAVAPVIANGQITFGYKVDSDVSPDFHGWPYKAEGWDVTVNLYAQYVASDGSVQLKLLKSKGNLDQTPGAAQSVSMSAADALAQCPSAPTGFVTKIDINSVVLETNEVDNEASASVVNARTVSLVLTGETGDQGLDWTYIVDHPSPIYQQHMTAQLWFADAGGNLLGLLKVADIDLKSGTEQHLIVPKESLHAIPTGAEKVIGLIN